MKFLFGSIGLIETVIEREKEKEKKAYILLRL